MIEVDFASKLGKFEDKVNYADVRILRRKVQNLRFEDGELTVNLISEDFSYGVRVIVDNKLGFAGSTDPKEFEEVVEKAIKLARVSKKKLKFPEVHSKASVKAKLKVDPFQVGERKKIEFLTDFYKCFLGKEFVKSVIITLNFLQSVEEFYSTYGSEVRQELIRSDLRAACVGKLNEDMRYASFSYSRNKGFEFLKEVNLEKRSKELTEKLYRLLRGKRLRGGKYDVICDNILTGVFFHEAVGHACEADLVLKKESILRNRLGKQIAVESLNLVDNPLVDENGNYLYDSEGIKGRKKYLIRNGKLENFLHSLETAAELRGELTGNGRAESPLFLPIPRMSNIIVEPGDWGKEEMIKETKRGVYAIDSGGGEVNVSTGDFLFHTKEAYLIENGEIKYCIKDFSILGNILKTLKNIVAIGKDTKPLHTGGLCGKDFQRVRVGERAPHIKVRGVLVGSG